jgi:serine/threonine protein phosphatase PrpC
MKCPACGGVNREGARFCRVCGAQLEVPASEAPSSAKGAGVEPPEQGSETLAAGVKPEVLETSGEDEEPAVEPGTALPEESGTEPEAPEALGERPESEVETVEIPVEESALGTGEVELQVTEGMGAKEGAAALESGSELPISSRQEGEAGEEVMPPSPWDEEEEPLPDAEDDVFAFWRDEAEALVPVEPGTVVGHRYVVVETLSREHDEILYHARDLQRCWQCGFEENAPDDAFCAQCGATLDRKLDVRLWELSKVGAEPSSGEAVVARFTEQDRHFLVAAGPEPEAEIEEPSGPEGIRLIMGQRSHSGRVRRLDEDSLLALTLAPTYESRTGPVQGLFVVADGMGGHAGGEIASKLALQVLAERVLRTIVLPELAGEMVLEEDISALLRQATIAANDAVFMARQKRENDMGTTLTAAYIRDDRLFLAHVGDSRAYHWSPDGLEQLTTDHSVVASMIANGQIKPEEIYTHPHRSIVTRNIGDKPVVEVDTDLLPLAPGDRVILCCDGLWEMVRDEGIEDVMLQEADPQMACDLFIRNANAAGGDDNISVIVVQVEAM